MRTSLAVFVACAADGDRSQMLKVVWYSRSTGRRCSLSAGIRSTWAQSLWAAHHRASTPRRSQSTALPANYSSCEPQHQLPSPRECLKRICASSAQARGAQMRQDELVAQKNRPLVAVTCIQTNINRLSGCPGREHTPSWVPQRVEKNETEAQPASLHPFCSYHQSL